MSQERRSERRASTALQARCHFGPYDTAAVMVHNLCAHGCKIQLLKRHEVGLNRKVSLMIGNLMGLSAVVIWELGDEAGLEFANALHPSIVDHLAYGQNPARNKTVETIKDKFGRTLPKLAAQQRQPGGWQRRTC